MFKLPLCIYLFALSSVANASVMLWSNKRLEISPLQVFNDKSLARLTEELKKPKIFMFQGDFTLLKDNLPKILEDKHSSYVPNADLNVENATFLIGDDINWMNEQLEQRTEENYLAIMFGNNRMKREAMETTTTPPRTVSGPILYSKGEAMIYSSNPPLLTIYDKSEELGEATSTTIDKRDITKVNVRIPVRDGSINLRFDYVWNGGYWYFLHITVLSVDLTLFNLTTSSSIMAPKNFSYHCQGMTVFSNDDGNVTLQLFDVQMQPDATDNMFSDAYDCVPFMTAPIWSGLFVSFILMVVLAMGLGALGSIKTMDKFENNKSKQLSITLNE